MRNIVLCLLLCLLIGKGLPSTDTLLTISHYLQKSLVVGIVSYIAQLDCSSAFDSVSHSGLIFKLKSIDVGGRWQCVDWCRWQCAGISPPTAGRVSWLMMLKE